MSYVIQLLNNVYFIKDNFIGTCVRSISRLFNLIKHKIIAFLSIYLLIKSVTLLVIPVKSIMLK